MFKNFFKSIKKDAPIEENLHVEKKSQFDCINGIHDWKPIGKHYKNSSSNIAEITYQCSLCRAEKVEEKHD